MALTKEQENVVRLRDRNLLVAAAAGSGKTSTLSQRIVSMIKDEKNGINIDELLVVTFTKAAAGEMREKISKAVEELLEQEPDNMWLKKQLSLLHNAKISTIHSFCMNVIKNYFYLADLDPAFRMGEEAELELLKSDVMEKLLEEKYTEAEPEFMNLVETYSGSRSDEKIEKLILKLYRFAESYPDPEEWLLEQAARYDGKALEADVAMKWADMVAEHIKKLLVTIEKKMNRALEICAVSGGPSEYTELFENELEMIKGIKACEGYSEMSEAFEKMTFERLPRVAKSVEPQKKDAAKSLRDAWKEELQKLKKDYFFASCDEMREDMVKVSGAVKELVNLAILFGKEYAAKKAEKNLLDFGDLEHFALKILTKKTEDGFCPSEAAESLGNRFHEILIDEYQDSNNVQEMILSSISGKRNNYFMVGDVKQSIYKFRLARPEIFMGKYNTYSDYPEVEYSESQKIDLHANFRSSNSILQMTNMCFERIMTDEFGGVAYDEKAALYLGKRPKAPADEINELLLFDADEAEDDENFKECEALLTANEIKKIISERRCLKYTDENGAVTEGRQIGYGDIVILLRSTAGYAETYLRILQEEGIPVYVENSSSLFKTPEVKAVVNLLRIIDNPYLDMPFAAVMYSRMFGFSAEELAKVRDTKCPLYDSILTYIEEGEDKELVLKLKNFTNIYDKVRNEAVYTPVHEIITLIYDLTGFYYKMGASANLELLVRQAVKFESTSYHGLFHFIRYIDKIIKYDIECDEAADAFGDSAVRIMTIHKSKGLQFPVVFIGGMNKKFNNMDAADSIIFHPELGIGPECIDTELRTKTPTLYKRIIARQIARDNVAEEMRILYVAMTRAEHKLYMTGTISKFGKKLEKWTKSCMNPEEQADYGALEGASGYLDFVGFALFGGRDADSSEMLARYEDGIRDFDLERDILCTRRLSEDKVEIKLSFVSKEKLLGDKSEAEVVELIDAIAAKEKLLKLAEELPQNAALKEAMQYEYPHNNEIKLPVKLSVSELKRRYMQEELDESEQIFTAQKDTEEFKSTLPKFLRTEEVLKGSDRGTIYHNVLEKLPIENIDSYASVEAYLAELESLGRLTAEESKVINRKKLLNFANSPLGKAMKKAALAGKLYRETPFVAAMPVGELLGCEPSESILVQGIIDAYYEEDDGLVLLDYKTDRVEAAEELVKKYAVQLEYYKKALEQLTGKVVKSKLIYSFALEKIIALD